MKRMMPSKRMDKVLNERKVKKESVVISLAKDAATFHKSARVFNITFDLQKTKATFNDIESIAKFTKESLGNE